MEATTYFSRNNGHSGPSHTQLIQSTLNLVREQLNSSESASGLRLLELLATAVEHIPAGITFSDPRLPNNPVVFVNQTFLALTGYTASEVLGRNCHFLQGPGTDPAAVAQLRQAIQKRERCEVELLNYRKNGEPFWNKLTLIPLFDKKQALFAYIGIQIEITDQKHIENALNESNSKFSTLANITTAGILIQQEYQIVFANPATADILGYTSDELTMANAKAFLHPEDKERVCRHHKRQLTENIERDSYEARLLRKDGSTCWVYTTNGLIEYAGKPALISTIFDLTELKKAQEEAEFIERRLSTVMQHAPIIIFSLDQDGIITLLEGQGASPFTDALERVVGTSIFDLLPIPKIHEGFRMAMQGISQQQSVEFKDLTFDVWYEPLYDETRQTIGIVGVAHNITRLKRVEKRLQERIKFEQLLNVINATFLQGYTTVEELDEQITQALTLLGEYVGVDRAYILELDDQRKHFTLEYEWCASGVFPQLGFADPVPTELTPWSFQKLNRSQIVAVNNTDYLPDEASAEKQVCELGAVRAFLLVPIESKREVIGCVGFDKLEAIPVWDERQITVLRLVSGVLSNILERRQALQALAQTNQALQAEEARTRAILFAIPDAILVVDANGRYLDVHIPDQFSVQVDPQRLLGKLPQAVLPAELAERKLETLARALESNSIQEFEFSQGEKTFNIRISPINADSAVIIQTDITERVLAAQSLADARDKAIEANQIKGQILAKVSHELRTPLGVILGYGELLREGTYGPVDSVQQEIIGEMLENAHYLSNLVDELLDQSKLEHHKLTLVNEPFHVAELLQAVVQKMSVLASRKALQLKSSLDPQLPQLLSGDKTRIQQILLNLVGNAIKFSASGSIEINIQMIDSANWSLEVCDDGPGIPYEAQAYIFEPFRQVDGSIKRQHGGTGLGLSIVKQLAQAMGGEIYLDSEPERGSCFIVYLPLIQPQAQEL